MAFVFIAADFIAAPATVQAANGLKFAKSITIMKGTETDYGIFNSVKSDKILNLKSSNTHVATVKKGYTLKELYCVEYGTGIRKKIKNGNVITLDGMHYILIEYKNVSKNYSYATFLFGK